jgi:hypothetical protein
MTWNLTALIARFRVLAGTPSTSQLSDLEITDFINDFYHNKLPIEIDDEKLNSEYTKVVRVYDSGTYDLSDDVVVLKGPYYIDDEQILIYQDEDSDRFFSQYPKIDTGAAYFVTFPNLAIGTNKAKIKNDAFVFRTSGGDYTWDAPTGETFLRGSTVPQNKYAAWRLEIGIDNAISIVEATNNASGYSTAAQAVQGLIDESDVRACMGFITVINTAGVFVPGTTALDATGVAATFTDGFHSTRSNPVTALLYKGTLYLGPKPDDTYVFRCNAKIKPTELVNGTDALTVDDWGQFVAYGAAIEYGMGIKDTELVSSLSAMYQKYKDIISERFAEQYYSNANRRSMPQIPN